MKQAARIRCGFTIVELLVSIAIIGLLLAVLLPGIFAARQSALSIQCSSNLRQLALASHSYSESFGVFPTRLKPFRILLPFIGEQNLASKISAGTASETEFRVQLYRCPAEDSTSRSDHTSYLLNEGSGFQKWGSPMGYNGITSDPYTARSTRPAEIIDGLATTAMFSERKVVRKSFTLVEANSEPNRFLWYIPSPMTSPTQFDSFVQTCLTQRTTPLPPVIPTSHDLLQTDFGYNHVTPPNSPGCYNAANQSDVFLFDMAVIAIPPTSNHQNFVNIAMADGAVRKVTSSIDIHVWQAIGTRNGRESVGEY